MCNRIIIFLLLLTFSSLSLKGQRVYGIVERGDKEILPIKYDRVTEGGASLGWKYALLDTLCHIVTPHLYDDLSNMKNFYIVKNSYDLDKNTKRGVLNLDLDTIIPFKYDYIDLFNLGDSLYFRVSNKNVTSREYEFGAMDLQGNVVIPMEYNNIYAYSFYRSPTSYRFIEVHKNGGIGLLTASGEQIFPPAYEEIHVSARFEGGRYAFNLKTKEKDSRYYGGKTFLLDESWQQVEPTMLYDQIQKSKDVEDIAIATLNGKSALMNNKGELITPFIYKEIETRNIARYRLSKDSLEAPYIIKAKRDGLDILLSNTGKELLQVKTLILDFGYLLTFDENKKRTLYNLQGQILSKEESELLVPLRRTLSENRLKGAVDRDGRLVIPYMYRDLDWFTNKYAIAIKGKKFGIIDVDNNIVLPFDYSYVELLDSNRCILRKNKYFFGDITGTPLTNKRYSKIEVLSKKHNLYIVWDGQKQGLSNIDGEEILPCEYQDIYSGELFLLHGKLFVMKNKRIGVYDFVNKKNIVSIEYDDMECIGKGDGSSGNWVFTDFKYIGQKGDFKCMISPEGDVLSSCIYDNFKYISFFQCHIQNLYMLQVRMARKNY